MSADFLGPGFLGEFPGTVTVSRRLLRLVVAEVAGDEMTAGRIRQEVAWLESQGTIGPDVHESDKAVAVSRAHLREVVPWILPPSRGGHVSQAAIDALTAAAGDRS